MLQRKNHVVRKESIRAGFQNSARLAVFGAVIKVRALQTYQLPCGKHERTALVRLLIGIKNASLICCCFLMYHEQR